MIGVAVLVIAILALQHPNGQGTAAGTATRTIVQTIVTTETPAPAQSGHSTHSQPRSTEKRSSASSSAASASASSSHSVRRLPLIVLNNTTITGLAEQASERFEDGGWTVDYFGNLTNNILSTCAYYDPSISGARAAARALQDQFPTIKRVKPKFDGLPEGPIVVVLTPDYS